METTTTTKTIHIKTVLNDEFRRFSLDKACFGQLVATIRSVYSLSETEALKISFIDDEKDLVVMSTDEELLYAADLVQPLRVIVRLTSQTTAEAPVEPIAQIGCGRGRRGRGRGKQEWADRKNWREQNRFQTKEERVQAKISRISENIKKIEALLLTDLPSNRVRTLSWKLENLKYKLENSQTYLEELKSGVTSSTPETPDSEVAPRDFFVPRGRGRGGRCGRGRGRFENRDPQLNEIWEKISACRQNLKEARKSGNQEEIEKCTKELDDAKIEKWELKQKMKEEGTNIPKKFAAEKAHKRECLKNLREARASGDSQRIEECRNAVAAAKEALQKAKLESA